MPKDEWGVKRVCPTTGKRFYDLNKDPIVSPYSGEVIDPTGGADSSSVKAISKEAEKPEKDAAPVDDADEVVLDDDSDIDVDDELLETDDDDNVSIEEIADVPAEDEDM